MSFSPDSPKSILVSSASQTQEQTGGDEATKSPWLSVCFNKSPETHVRTIKNPVTIRSVSTFNLYQLKDQISSGAPFPSIPTRNEVQTMKSEIDNEIIRLRTDLSSLQYERNKYNHNSRPLIPESPENGIHEYRGIAITDQFINSIVKENQQKAKEADMNILIDSPSFKIPEKHLLSKFKSFVDIPSYKKVLDDHKSLLLPMFAIDCAEKDIIVEREAELVEEYSERTDKWKNHIKYVDEYHHRTEQKNEAWPIEFNFDRTASDDVARLKWVAPDIPMFLTHQEKQRRCYYDTNGFVEDPIKEFEKFKNRTAWTEEEKAIFVEKYRLSPKDFDKIHEALPEKSIKEIMEFYYLNRYQLSLKENEGVAKRRGGKKKVITEGTKKKNY